MWQNLLRHCAVLTKVSEEFVPLYLAEIRHDMRQTTRPWVVDADIEGAFNNIGHAALEQAIGNFPARGLITQWLKAGYVEAEMLHPTEAGVPQGGVSTLLTKLRTRC